MRHRPTTRWTGALATGALVAGGFMLAPTASAQSDDPVDGALTSGDTLFPNQGNGGYDVEHYDLDIAWTPSTASGEEFEQATVDATTGIEATTTGAPLKSFALDFEGGDLDVTSVTVDGEDAAFERIDGERTEAPEPPEMHKLVITPATPVDGDFDVEIAYAGVPSIHVDQDGSWEGWVPTDDGMIFMGQPIGSMAGYPNNNTPSDKATYTISLDVPTELTNAAGTGDAAAVSNGVLESTTESADGERATWVWQQSQPQASELTIITIGKYDMRESEVALSDGSTVPEWSFIDSAYSENDKASFDGRRSQLSTITQNLESIYGPYPLDSTGAVIDRVPDGINYALETQDRSFFPGLRGFTGNTLVHELVHQWYGDDVSPITWQDIWINEGMASWGPTWNTQVLAADEPNPDAVRAIWFDYWNETPADSGDWDIAPSGMSDTSTLYGFQTYDRGAMFYEALRTILGDEDYFRFTKRWTARYGGGNGGAAEHEALAERVSGRNLTGFYRDWIFDADKPAWPLGPVDVTVRGQNVVGDKLRVTKVRPVPEGATVNYVWKVGGVRKDFDQVIQLREPYLGKPVTLNVTVSQPGFRSTTETVKLGRVEQAPTKRG